MNPIVDSQHRTTESITLIHYVSTHRVGWIQMYATLPPRNKIVSRQHGPSGQLKIFNQKEARQTKWHRKLKLQPRYTCMSHQAVLKQHS